MKINNQIKQARIVANITQGELAERCNIKQAQISMLESGKVNPSIDMLALLAEALQTEFIVGITNPQL